MWSLLRWNLNRRLKYSRLNLTLNLKLAHERTSGMAGWLAGWLAGRDRRRTGVLQAGCISLYLTAKRIGKVHTWVRPRNKIKDPRAKVNRRA